MDTLPPRKRSATEIPYLWVRRVRRKTRTYWYWTVPGEKRGQHRYFPYTVEGLQAARAAASEYQIQREEQPMDNKNYGTSDHPMTREETKAEPRAIAGSTPEQSQPPQWMAGLDERTNKHIAFAREYARTFAHGAPGHLDLMTIAKLADLLNEVEQRTKRQQILKSVTDTLTTQFKNDLGGRS